ncbi:hypothetical protein BDV23DRAFT_68559 [Aspergillus alliaceus]|uniref:Uncharacterized protein n=1 Tax=Petromyces alliaceus TaxID=209559 RepID=A0A5N7CC94_PETAA|nr:hypothetical protein BDV23DRAFT_68559 [Aspergillus alliaceus]
MNRKRTKRRNNDTVALQSEPGQFLVAMFPESVLFEAVTLGSRGTYSLIIVWNGNIHSIWKIVYPIISAMLLLNFLSALRKGVR